MPHRGWRHGRGNEGRSPVDIWGRVVQAEGTEHSGLAGRTQALTLSEVGGHWRLWIGQQHDLTHILVGWLWLLS